MEQQSGPPSEGTRDETGSTRRFTRDEETRPSGRFAREPEPRSPELEESGETTPPEVLPVPDKPQSDAGEGADAGTQIMSNLPHSRPQQRSQKRAAPKRQAKSHASASTSGRKTAAGRAKATSASRGRRAQASTGRRTGAKTPSGGARSGVQAIPGRAVGTAVDIATAPWKLTFAATRRAANAIGRRLGI